MKLFTRKDTEKGEVNSLAAVRLPEDSIIGPFEPPSPDEEPRTMLFTYTETNGEERRTRVAIFEGIISELQ